MDRNSSNNKRKTITGSDKLHKGKNESEVALCHECYGTEHQRLTHT